jgi:hypothetical protein
LSRVLLTCVMIESLSVMTVLGSMRSELIFESLADCYRTCAFFRHDSDLSRSAHFDRHSTFRIDRSGSRIWPHRNSLIVGSRNNA